MNWKLVGHLVIVSGIGLPNLLLGVVDFTTWVAWALSIATFSYILWETK